MSRECCGPDEQQPRDRGQDRTAPVLLSLGVRPPVGADGCTHDAGPGREDTGHSDSPLSSPGEDDCCGPKRRDPDADLVFESMAPWWRDRALLLPALSGGLLALGLVAGQADAPESLVLVLEASALAAGAWTFVPGALRRLARRRLGVGLLMTIAAVGAVLLGKVGEAAALAFLFSIAEALEERAMDRAQHGLRSLLALIPTTARVDRGGATVEIPVAEISVGDVLVIGAGDRAATDGVVAEGRSSLDTSAVTGESIPVEVWPGESVLAGSVNTLGTLRVEATADGRDNSLTQIVRLVEEAHARKGDRARLADRIARPLVPAVLILAALVAAVGATVTGDMGTWVERALVVLVAASPCAMAIAVPVTVISAIGAASRLGVVIKSGEAFELLGTIRQVAFDKTGTLTRNQPEVVEVHAVSGRTESDVLAVAAALEASSTHPLAVAVLAAAETYPRASDVEEHAGSGVTGVVDGERARLGSPRWVEPRQLATQVEAMTGAGMSVIVVEIDGQVAGALGVRDEPRPEAAETVRMLNDRSIGTLMLTGDNSRTAHALAAEIGIIDVRAEQLPVDKATAVQKASRSVPTAMIGDGINDAPALAAATVGIAMGVTGSAAAVESADVAFTGHDLRLIPHALDHARRGRRLMTSNIGLALAIIVVLVPLAIFGVLSLAEVVLVHEVAEVVVILNGARAARVRRAPAGLPEVASARSGPVLQEVG